MSPSAPEKSVAKAPTGITGLDQILGGGLPRGRATLVAGGPGSGKTVLSTEFIVRGAAAFGEPGLLVSFEQGAADILNDTAGFGWPLAALIEDGRVAIRHIPVRTTETEEVGNYDLTGLIVQIGHAAKAVAAQRLVIDGIDNLLSGFSNERVVRAEICRLLDWSKERGLTTLITAGRGEITATRHGLAEYLMDCVLLLDSRTEQQILTRRLRVMKFRGSRHGIDEYPFLIGPTGVSTFPVTSVQLDYGATIERVSSGIARLDRMFAGEGFYRGSTILISGTAGTGKTSIVSTMVDAACRRGERAIYFSFEEAGAQIIRNMRSIGVDLEPWITAGRLCFHSVRPARYGLETHIVEMRSAIDAVAPQLVVLDPVSGFASIGSNAQIASMMARMIDYLKSSGITTVMTCLIQGGAPEERTDIAVSSVADTWLMLRDIESGGERNKGLFILKSRGMAHSNQIREFRFSAEGIDLVDVYLGPAGVLTGSARAAQEARDHAEAVTLQQENERRQRVAIQKRAALEAQIAALQLELAASEEDVQRAAAQAVADAGAVNRTRAEMARLRHADRSG